MFCKNCGADIPAHSVACPKCGMPNSNDTYVNPVLPPKAPNSISGFVCSLLGVLVPFVGFILSIIGLILCSKGKKAISHNPNAYSGTGYLTARFILGIIGLVWSAILILYLALAGAIFGGAMMTLSDFM